MNKIQLTRAAETFHTWDAVVECSDDLTSEEKRHIGSLGYYGKFIKDNHIDAILQGVKYDDLPKDKPYVVVYQGIDGSDAEEFSTLDEVKAYVKDRLQWAEGNSTFMSDYARYTLEGLTLEDIGIKWQEKLP